MNQFVQSLNYLHSPWNHRKFVESDWEILMFLCMEMAIKSSHKLWLTTCESILLVVQEHFPKIVGFRNANKIPFLILFLIIQRMCYIKNSKQFCTASNVLKCELISLFLFWFVTDEPFGLQKIVKNLPIIVSRIKYSKGPHSMKALAFLLIQLSSANMNSDVGPCNDGVILLFYVLVTLDKF